MINCKFIVNPYGIQAQGAFLSHIVDVSLEYLQELQVTKLAQLAQQTRVHKCIKNKLKVSKYQKKIFVC